jgi:hypothetical protein
MLRQARSPWKDAALLAPALLMFFYLAGDGLRAGLFPDEMMNIHGYWREPWSRLLRANLFFFEASYRPAGALFYRPLFDLFGFNPLPYRIVCFALLTANLILVYLLSRRLSSSAVTASLAAVLFSYNAYCSDLYYSSATIFDLLCFACYAGALLLYAHRREQGRLGPAALAALALLQIFALNAKEMAVTLPLMLAAYEFLFHRRSGLDLRGPLLTLLLAALAASGRLVGEGSMAANPAYRPSLHGVAHVLSVYTGQLLYRIPAAGAVIVSAFVGCAALALFIPKPHVRFAALFGLITPLPVLLISQRSLYVMYVPMLGFALLAASLIVSAIPDRLRDRLPAIALPILLAAILLPPHLQYKPLGTYWVASEAPKVRFIVSELDRRLPALPKGARLFFEEDPLPEDDWFLTLLFQLYYRDPTLLIARRKHAGESCDDCRYILALRDNPWTLTLRPGPSLAPGTPSSTAAPGTGAP